MTIASGNSRNRPGKDGTQSSKPMPALAINVADAGARRSAEAAEPPRHPTLQTLVRVSLHPSKHLASLPYTLHERRQLITTGAEPQGELEIQLVRPRPISSRSDSGSLRGSGMLGAAGLFTSPCAAHREGPLIHLVAVASAGRGPRLIPGPCFCCSQRDRCTSTSLPRTIAQASARRS